MLHVLVTGVSQGFGEALAFEMLGRGAHVLGVGRASSARLDTPMQALARAQPKDRLPSVDLFEGFHARAQLVAPDIVARKVAGRLVLGPVEQGRTYRYAEL